MSDAFIEDYVSPKVDPLAPTHIDPDWTAIEIALGEAVEQDGEDKTARLLRSLFGYLIAPGMSGESSQIVTGRRTIALAWVLDPGLFESAPSAAKLARRIGINRLADFYAYTADAVKTFKITNRAQSRGWNRGTGKEKHDAA